MLMQEEKMLIESGKKEAIWMAALDQESNSGAHENSESFVMADGSYMTEQNIMDGNAVEDMAVNWGSADKTPGV
jgi:hypothetical protein